MDKCIIFDVDGTLVDASSSVAESWNEAARSLGYSFSLTKNDMRSVMGLTMDAIGDKLFPNMEKEKKEKLLKASMEHEIPYLREHPGLLFPKEEETLKTLVKMGYRLAIVSNAQRGYIEAFLYGHPSIKDLFFDHACWGDNELPKGENISILMKRNNIKEAIYVGDTIMDEEASKVANVPFAYASYGFGKSFNPRYILKTFSDLLKLAKP